MNKDFTDLEVWQKAHQLALDIYQLCKTLPPEEKYGLADQIKRSSTSIKANIAEGYGRFYYQDNISFCRKARGSLYETKDHLITIKDLEYSSEDECLKLIEQTDEISRLLNGYIRHLNNKKPS